MARVNSFEQLAADAAQNIEDARKAGQQLTFLPDEPAPGDSDRAKRGKGKATSQLRDWCAARGFRMPEDVLVEMAGMATGDDAFIAALARTEQVLAWATAGARKVGYVFDRDLGGLREQELDTSATMAQRLAAFQFVFTAQLRAVEAMLPYGLAKLSGDPAPVNVTQIIMPGPQSAPQPAAPRGPDQARDVTPQARRIGPPPMPHEIQQNQHVAQQPDDAADGARRTDGASD